MIKQLTEKAPENDISQQKEGKSILMFKILFKYYFQSKSLKQFRCNKMS